MSKRDRRFIFHTCISCGKTFLLETKFLASWPYPWLLTYFWKKLTLTITSEPKVIGLNITHIYSLWQDLSVDTNISDLVALTLTLTYMYFCKNLNWLPRGGISPFRTDPDLLFSWFMGNESIGTNKLREPLRGSQAICLIRSPIHSGWLPRKKTLIPYIYIYIYNASNNDPFQGSKLTFLATCKLLRVILIWTRKLLYPTRNYKFSNYFKEWLIQPCISVDLK